jgi:hypothetical protein
MCAPDRSSFACRRAPCWPPARPPWREPSPLTQSLRYDAPAASSIAEARALVAEADTAGASRK